MRPLLVCFALALLPSAALATPDDERVKELLQSEDYTVTWGSPPTYDAGAELEIGDGSGHGGTLGWRRFRPGADGVEVLHLQFDEGWKPYKSKWPPDEAPLVIKRARMKTGAYEALLRQLAVVAAAGLERVFKGSITGSSSDFWVQVRLAEKEKSLLDLEWAGYRGSSNQLKYARPQAAVTLAREAVKDLEFKEGPLTDEERGWLSAKFLRDWAKFKDLEFHWWVRERYIVTIGAVGDKSVLKTLREILGGDPKDRCVYHAINAITRLTGKDVREKPVEEMDVEKTRESVLRMLEEE
ncbi:MAG: hypothetical protein HYY93_03175 [Planctomycetes bacterium]|nr:hypothetical protein [Planctomycetota bacterium]